MATVRLVSSRPTPGVGRTKPFDLAVREHCEHLFRSPEFDASERSRKFLRFVVDETLDGRGDCLTQASIATAVFGRDSSFDAVMDPIVRVQAGRLRRSLERYYLLTRHSSPFQIELPKGRYAPVFAKAGLENPEAPIVDVQEPEDRPTVAVLTFETTSGVDAEFAARLKDEVATELFRYGTVRVVRKRDLVEGTSAPVAPRFELRGSVRRVGEDSWVIATLVDRKSGVQLWSEEFHTHAGTGSWSCSLDDIGRVIAACVGGEHGIVLRQLVSEVHPMGAILRSHHFLLVRHPGDPGPAIRALEQLSTREPENPLAWTQLARLGLANYAYELSGLHTPIEATIDHACQAVMLDPMGVRANCVLAAALLVKGELPAARERIDRTLRHHGDSLVYREVLGWQLALCGDWERGMAIVRDADSRNPYCLPYLRHAMWADHLRRGEFDQAYSAALEYRDASGFWPQLMAASCLGHLDRADEARLRVTELLAAKPDFQARGRTLVSRFIKPLELSSTIFRGLAKAGLTLA